MKKSGMPFLNIGLFLKIIFCGILLSINISFVFAEKMESEYEANELKYMLSFDTSYTMIALQYSGFGLGLSYEHKITDSLSMKLIYGQMVCFSPITVVTIDQQLFLYYYIFNNGLDKLYLGLGHGGNLFIYPNKENESVDAALSITPILGWKWKISKYLMIDPFIGWQFDILLTNNYENFNKYLNTGFQWGINLKIVLLTHVTQD
jgi:hypothetical protein